MFSLCDLHFLLCSHEPNILRAQRIMGFFIVITHKSTGLENQITWMYSLYMQQVKVFGYQNTAFSSGI